MRRLAPLFFATTTVVSVGAPGSAVADPVERVTRAASARPPRAFAPRRGTPTSGARTATTRLQLRLGAPPALAPTRTTLSFGRTTAAPTELGAPEIPWFWEALRSRVYAAMPHVQRRDLTMTFAPVVVTGTEDTVPGLGISGDF